MGIECNGGGTTRNGLDCQWIDDERLKSLGAQTEFFTAFASQLPTVALSACTTILLHGLRVFSDGCEPPIIYIHGGTGGNGGLGGIRGGGGGTGGIGEGLILSYCIRAKSFTVKNITTGKRHKTDFSYVKFGDLKLNYEIAQDTVIAHRQRKSELENGPRYRYFILLPSFPHVTLEQASPLGTPEMMFLQQAVRMQGQSTLAMQYFDYEINGSDCPWENYAWTSAMGSKSVGASLYDGGALSMLFYRR
ncbi:hypothetical protein B0H14DRAFT_2567228 [Mycena olivaceomarginata]|nr:hypothetical protein B0H14DRAFT_2567228 [Mycena olivaceomarginata]